MSPSPSPPLLVPAATAAKTSGCFSCCCSSGWTWPWCRRPFSAPRTSTRCASWRVSSALACLGAFLARLPRHPRFKPGYLATLDGYAPNPRRLAPFKAQVAALSALIGGGSARQGRRAASPAMAGVMSGTPVTAAASLAAATGGRTASSRSAAAYPAPSSRGRPARRRRLNYPFCAPCGAGAHGPSI